MNSMLRFSIIVSTALLALGFPAQAQQAGTSPVKIFILAGQSNMLGPGRTSRRSTTPGTLEYIAAANDPDGDYQFLVDGGGAWVVRDDVWIRDQNGQAAAGSPRATARLPPPVGPELGFGHHVGDLYEKQVLIVKAAWGGKSLAVDFRPPSSGGTTGFYYNEILRLVNEMTANSHQPRAPISRTTTAGGYEIAGFGWHQGWNDRVDPGLQRRVRDQHGELHPGHPEQRARPRGPGPALRHRHHRHGRELERLHQVEQAQLDDGQHHHLPGLRRQRGRDRHPDHLRRSGLLATGRSSVARGDQGYPLEPQRQDLRQHRPRDGRRHVPLCSRPLPVPPARQRRPRRRHPHLAERHGDPDQRAGPARRVRDRRRRAGQTRPASSTPPPSRACTTTNCSSPCPATPAIR